jgi:hypothetical protein
LDHLKSDIFNWEVPIETVPLPSQGKIYNEDNWFYNKETVDIKSMTANEEDILASQAYIKKGTVVDELIKSCIMDKSANVKDLLVGDKNALALAIRITGYGAQYNCSVICNHCQHINEKIFDLSSLGIKSLGCEPVERGKNIFEYVLPVSKKTVHFKLLTTNDVNKNNDAVAQKKSMLGEMSIGAVTSNLETQIISIDGISDFPKIKKFIEIMPAFDSRALRGYMAKIQPGIDMSVNFKCEKCSNESSAILPITANFFWPPAIT